MSGLRINLFGEFQVRRGEELIGDREWGRQKTRPLLKLLLTRPGHAFSRDEIIEALWPAASPEAGERSLRATASLLRRVLEPDLERGSESRYILSQRPGYVFAERPECRMDVREVERHLGAAEAAQRDERLEEAIHEYREALELVRGEFLAEDPYEEWAVEARQHWRERHLAALSGLAECLALRGRYTEAIEACELALALDRYREGLYRQLMLYHYCAGEQALALQAYRRYARTLDEELGTVPSPELARLREQIEGRDVPGVDTLRRYPRPRRPLRFPYALSRTHFVGRDREYAWLAGRLQEAAEGAGSAVAVEGEAGVGKTRLVEEFLGYARSSDARVLSGRCYEVELSAPLEPIMDALDPVIDRARYDVEGYQTRSLTDDYVLAEEERRTTPSLEPALTHREREVAGLVARELTNRRIAEELLISERTVATHVREILKKLGLRSRVQIATWAQTEMSGSGFAESGMEVSAYPREVNPHDGARVYQMLTRELIRESRAAGHGGLILFVDDLQWGDPATLEFLSFLAKRTLKERLVLIVAYRREDAAGLSGWLEHLAERRAITTLSLSRLSVEDTTELLGRMSSQRFGELPYLADLLYRESEGNPFYAVEYLRWLIEAGAVEIDARRYISGLKTELSLEGALPSSLRSLVQARVTGLGDAARDLLKLAAVIGRTFDLRLLCTVGACDEAHALDIIESLMASGLVVEAGEEGVQYHFSHDKLRQALYEDIGGAQRRALHLRVASTLKEEGGEPSELAHHYLRAQAWQPALESLVRAARRAEGSSAWENALRSYTRALEIVEKLPAPDEKRFELLEARENLLEHIDRKVERAATVQEMLDLANRLGDRARLAEVNIRRMGVLAALSDADGAAEAYRTAVSMFRELGDRVGEGRTHREMAYVCWTQRDYAASLEALFQALRTHHEIGDRLGEAGDVSNVVECYLALGDYERALEWAERAVKDYSDLEGYERVVGQAVRLDTLVAFNRKRGDLRAALAASRELLRMWIERGDSMWMVTDSHNCAMLCLALGDSRQALEHFRTAASISRKMGHARDEGHSLVGVGISLEQLGDLSGAASAYRQSVELLQTAYELSGTPEELSAKAEALTLLANVLHRSLEEPEEPLEAYEAAARIYRELGDAWHLRKVLLGMAGLRWRVGDLAASSREYQEVLESARDDGVYKAAALAGLGVVYRELGRFKESVQSSREALRLLQNLDDPRAEAYVLSSLAESYSRIGQHPSARSCLQRSLRLRQKIGDHEGETGALRDLAKVYIDLGDTARVRAYLDEIERKNEAPKVLAARTSAEPRYVAPGKVENFSAGEAEDHTRIRWLNSYISDEKGRKFFFRYAAPSMEMIFEDSRKAGLPLAADAVARTLLEPGMFR